MKQAPIFVPPLIASTESLISVDTLDEAKELHEQGKYIESIHKLIDGLGGNLRKKYGDADQRVFVIPHGTITIRIQISDEIFSISTEGVRLPQDERRIAMMRQLLDLNTRRLMLARFVKQGDVVQIEYHCPLAETHTYKLYSLINNICYIGKSFDEEFVGKFGAERLSSPQIRPYSTESIKRLLSALQTTGQSALSSASDFTNERNHNAAWAVLSTCLLQFLYYANPKGTLHRDIDQALTDLDDDLPTTEQVLRASTFISELLKRSEDELSKDLYYEEVLSSDKNASSLQSIRESFEAGYEEATKALQNSNHERALVRLLHIIYRAYHHYDMQEDINQILVKALRDASGKSIEKASLRLHQAVKYIMVESDSLGQSITLWQRVVRFFHAIFK